MLPDLNLLLYAVDAGSPRHDAARPWLEERLSGTEEIGLAWMTLIGFARLITSQALLARPLSGSMALDVVDGWLARPQVVVLHPTDRHARILRGLLQGVGTAGNLVTDAHLAALAIEHGATLESSDHDFGRFAGLRWEDPLR